MDNAKSFVNDTAARYKRLPQTEQWRVQVELMDIVIEQHDPIISALHLRKKREMPVRVSHIMYTHTGGGMVQLTVQEDDKQFAAYSLSEPFNHYPELQQYADLVLCHLEYHINLAFIEEPGPNFTSVRMKDGKIIPVSRRHRHEVRIAYEGYLRRHS